MMVHGPFLLFLCASVLCIMSTRGSVDYKHPLFVNAETRLPQAHSIHRRQTTHEVEVICGTLLLTEWCTSGYYEDVAYLLARCNQTTSAREIRDMCRVNSKGDACGAILTFTNGYEDACRSTYRTMTCTPECRERLLTVREEWGCCISVFNDSSNSIGDKDQIRSPVWPLCGVELVTEECPVPFDVPTEIVDPSCNESDLYEQAYSRVGCRREYIDSLRDAVAATEICQDYFDLNSVCAVDEDGEYCASGSNLGSQANTASYNCRETNNTCSPLCREALSNVTAAGCCLINEYNGTAFQSDFLSYELWQQCGLTSPGFCAQRFDDSESRISNTPSSNALSITPTISFAVAVMMTVLMFLH